MQPAKLIIYDRSFTVDKLSSHITMSQFDASPTNPTGVGERPQHHQHNPSEPLPGARGGQPAADYSADTIERTDGQTTGFDQGRRFENRDSDRVQGLQPTYGVDDRGEQNVPVDSRPTDYQPTRAGGAPGDDDELPEGKASMMDKVIGKTQKVRGVASFHVR
ncbi:hypothetical protein EWM64_g4534 [Hericium alpestre]|uniref:Uncharacterized protein n=1 Tax=Hericium alpestre TaxID=135208 RepID=A0A4Y9ZY43_9AGAM|nr:hypothetical protein EWM64_g4534 [Hericium alpestre]